MLYIEVVIHHNITVCMTCNKLWFTGHISGWSQEKLGSHRELLQGTGAEWDGPTCGEFPNFSILLIKFNSWICGFMLTAESVEGDLIPVSRYFKTIKFQRSQRANNNRKQFVSRIKLFVNDDEYNTSEVTIRHWWPHLCHSHTCF